MWEWMDMGVGEAVAPQAEFEALTQDHDEQQLVPSTTSFRHSQSQGQGQRFLGAGLIWE